jgi:hypothetical protein
MSRLETQARSFRQTRFQEIDMITHSQARSMAEANWGRGGTKSSKTNRKGAFYFSCSSHGGFVIDGRCLSEKERTLMKKYLKPELANEVVRISDESVRRFRSPFSRRSLRYLYSTEEVRDVEIFFAEEDCNWAIPCLIAGISVEGMTRENALKTFKQWREPSNHQLAEILALAGETC